MFGFLKKKNKNEESKYDDFEDKYDDPGLNGDYGCDACGNPAYPKCKASCNMFDD